MLKRIACTSNCRDIGRARGRGSGFVKHAPTGIRGTIHELPLARAQTPRPRALGPVTARYFGKELGAFRCQLSRSIFIQNMEASWPTPHKHSHLQARQQ